MSKHKLQTLTQPIGLLPPKQSYSEQELGLVPKPQPKVIAAQFTAGVPSKFGLTTSFPYMRDEHEFEVVSAGLKVSWMSMKDVTLRESVFVPWSNIAYLRFEGRHA